ncbi:unnamed protein product [Caenorhabditis bovis]|uniref:Uncharacterized protein n=1 Tax=Caenorhabditis bovis TaxID=2654633 RepID=A0A8S1EJQ2_9PELO|nr:unnamed protein product [Caenorhabditis bovis]
MDWLGRGAGSSAAGAFIVLNCPTHTLYVIRHLTGNSCRRRADGAGAVLIESSWELEHLNHALFTTLSVRRHFEMRVAYRLFWQMLRTEFGIETARIERIIRNKP